MDSLTALSDRRSPGCFVIVDDYGVFENCRTAIADFRGARGIRASIHDIDGSGVFWQRDE